MQIAELVDQATGASAKILVSQGFNCFSWCARFDKNAEARELLWAEQGFEAGDKRPSGSGIPLLFPFPGRIGTGEFEFEGRTYRVAREGENTNAIHGFVFNRPWRIVEQSSTQVTAQFQASIDDTTILQQWPSDFRVQATYRLGGNRLEFDAEFTNCGESNLPWGFGTHAYFRLPLAESSEVANTVLTAPVNGQWELTDMLPTGKLLDLPTDLNLTDGESLATREYDTPYRISTQTGEVVTAVTDPTSGRSVVQTFDAQQYPHVVIYTPGHREAVCLEPYSCVPDPFAMEARGVPNGLRILSPGESATTRVVLAAAPTG